MEKQIDCTKCKHYPKARQWPYGIDVLVCSINLNAIRGIGPDRKQYPCLDYAPNKRAT